MPITKSAIKALRQEKKRTEANRATKSRAKTALDAMKKNPTAENLAAAFSAVDRAVKNNIFHRNKAAHLKSQLAKLVAGAKPAAKAVAEKATEATKTVAKVTKTAKTAASTAKKAVAKAK